MKQLSLLTLICICILTSCKPTPQIGALNGTIPEPRERPVLNAPKVKEEFRTLDQNIVNALNQRINDEGLTSERAIIMSHAPKAEAAEGNYSYNLNINNNNGNIVIELTEEGRMDDSLEGLKVKMFMTKANGQYVVNAIQESYRCREGRGHTNWANVPCM